jgi:hypothetical protein
MVASHAMISTTFCKHYELRVGVRCIQEYGSMLVYSQGTAMFFLVPSNAVNFVNIMIISVQRFT